jgi:hypothetical protein
VGHCYHSAWQYLTSRYWGPTGYQIRCSYRSELQFLQRELISYSDEWSGSTPRFSTCLTKPSQERALLAYITHIANRKESGIQPDADRSLDLPINTAALFVVSPYDGALLSRPVARLSVNTHAVFRCWSSSNHPLNPYRSSSQGPDCG